MSEEDIVRFEQEHQLRLPEDYRSWLQQPASPGLQTNEIVRPGDVPTDMSGLQRSYWKGLPHLHTSFPLDSAWLWETDPHPPTAAQMETVAHGTLPIGSNGCGQYPLLVVTGRERGSVWLLADVGIVPSAPTFIAWINSSLIPQGRRSSTRRTSI